MTQYFSPHVAITNTINDLYKRVFKCADRNQLSPRESDFTARTFKHDS